MSSDDMVAVIDSVEPGEIVVIATGRSNKTAFWGDLFSAATKARGAQGLCADLKALAHTKEN